MGRIKNPDLGPGWGDVATTLADMHRTWGGSFVFTVRWGYTASRENGLYVLLERSYRHSKPHDSAKQQIGATYPNPDSRTMPALMWRMCMEMGERLEKAKIDSEAQTAF